MDCRLLSNKPTGISRYTEQLIFFYSDYIKVSKLILIVNSKDLALPYGLDFLETKLSPFNILDCIKFSFLINKKNIDLLHSPFYSSVFFNKRFIKVVSVMDLMYRIIPHYFHSNKVINFFKVIYFDIIVFFSTNNSNLIISISESTKNDLINFFRLNSSVIKLGFTELNSNSLVSNKILNLKLNEYYLFVGNNRKQKNLNFLISTFLKSNSNKKLLIVGGKCQPGNNIINIESVNESDLAYLYKFCYCFVFPSLYEGFGLPILEAISFSRPILISRSGSLTEFSYFNLNYFDPIDEIELLRYFNNENLIRKGSNYNKMKELYNWNNYFITLEDLLIKLI